MNLDLPTLMVMQSFALACAGAVLLFTWLQNRIVSALAFWGLANILAAAGILALMLGVMFRQPAWSAIGGVLLPFQASFMWKPAPLVLLLGPVFVGVAGGLPGLHEATAALSLTIGAAYTFAAAMTLWLGRRERLAARWPLIILSAVHGTALLIGTYSTFTGSTGRDSVPSLTSLFGFIYFESIVFALGTSVFILALVKERNEAISKAAARTDSLTGIANRVAFLESAARVLERCRRDAAPVSVIMFDLDRFKAINDRYGHAVGDAVIRTFCEIAAAALRPNDVFGRVGGEEFAAVLQGSSMEAACLRAERIRISFAEDCRFVGGRQVNATVSGGVSVSVNAEHTLEALLEYSDVALYAAKADGRNRIRRADQPLSRLVPSNIFNVA
jgi:diguanylate cyclase (GGDEF)-like protein